MAVVFCHPVNDRLFSTYLNYFIHGFIESSQLKSM
jgi:hypothetical protein